MHDLICDVIDYCVLSRGIDILCQYSLCSYV